MARRNRQIKAADARATLALALPGVARLRRVVIAVGRREKCGARTRAGAPCKAPAVWDPVALRPRNGRCRMHGGLSTGAKTPEGKARQRAGKALSLQRKGNNP